jgi:hypothetical protein
LADITSDGQPDLVVTDACDSAGIGTTAWLVYPGLEGGFGSATAWNLPELSALPIGREPFARIAGGGICENLEVFNHATLDLTGDGTLDLVVTNACDNEGVGRDYWLVYPGGANGFGDAEQWALPSYDALPLTYSDHFENLSGSVSCGVDGGGFLFATTDITGDGAVDLVVTEACDEGGVGADRWLVHPGQDGGFGPAIAWSLPADLVKSAADPDPYERMAGEELCVGGGVSRFATVDITRDGRPDLVFTDACDSGGVGVEHWLVHPGEDGGFGTAAVWALPDYDFLDMGDLEPFGNIGTPTTCQAGGRFAHATAQLAGSEALDMTVTDACDDGGIGTLRWFVHTGRCE